MKVKAKWTTPETKIEEYIAENMGVSKKVLSNVRRLQGMRGKIGAYTPLVGNGAPNL